MSPDQLLIDLAESTAKDLLNKLGTRAPNVQDKYDYYDADNDVHDFGIATPRKMRKHHPGIGWAKRAVNTLADRVSFDGFANDTASINDMLDEINGTTTINNVKDDAFIVGVAFAAVSDDGTGRKVIVPFTALEATGVVNATTGLLSAGLGITRWGLPNDGRYKQVLTALDFILFMPEFTAVFENRTLVDIYFNRSKRCQLHQITHGSSANRPLGKGRITNTVRRIIQEVSRLKVREEIAEEFYALPQRYITGLANGAEKDPNLDSAIGMVWAITKEADGENDIKIDQLQQMSIDGFIGAKKDKARDFCAETALTLRNLGYETGNPTSAESLSAMSDDLLLEAKNSQKEMGEQIKQIVTTLYMETQGIDTVPTALKKMIPAWEPVFQVDIGAAGDAIYKIYQAMPELIGTPQGYQMLGVSVRQAEELVKARAAAKTNSFMQGGA